VTEILFYQLERQPLEKVLPQLLEKTLERGWRACIQAGGEERVEALSYALWTWREESFIPHGTARDGNAELQPVWITAGDENPNGAVVRFLVDGATIESFDGLARAVYMFDAADPQALEQARARWKEIKALGHEATYWQQDEAGRWAKRG
jgi:DNA polymerase-3 subunit chi